MVLVILAVVLVVLVVVLWDELEMSELEMSLLQLPIDSLKEWKFLAIPGFCRGSPPTLLVLFGDLRKVLQEPY